MRTCLRSASLPLIFSSIHAFLLTYCTGGFSFIVYDALLYDPKFIDTVVLERARVTKVFIHNYLCARSMT